MSRPLPAWTFYLLCLLLAGCGSRQLTAVPEVALALDGPALFIVGEYKGQPLTGNMDRTCMVGVGHMTLRVTAENEPLLCEGDLDEEPTAKARVHGTLFCGKDRTLYFTLRNLGPDQGVGIAREADSDDLAVIFYHSCPKEAKRRLPGAVADIEKVRKARDDLSTQ